MAKEMHKLGQLLASKGRYGDTMLAHITPEEADLLESHGGSGTINPETGLPEYWKGWKAIRKVAKVAAPILGTLLAPGIGTALGVGTTTAGAIGGGLGGAIGGAMGGGGLKGALTGGALGAGGGYLGSGGLTELAPETSNALFNSTGGLIGSSNGNTSAGIGSLLGLSGSTGSPLGTAAGTTLDVASGINGLQGATQGTGIAGAVSRGSNSLGSLLSPSGGGSSIFGSGSGGSLLGGAYSLYANNQAQDDLEKSQKEAMGLLSPYLQTGQQANQMLASKLASGELGGTFTPPDLTQDPGYQFNLNQGMKALDRTQAARGNYFSGAALKDAQDYGQGLADNTYNQAYQRWLQGQNNTYGMLSGQSGSGLQATNTGADLTTSLGSAKANANIGTANIINQTLASLLRPRFPSYNFA